MLIAPKDQYEQEIQHLDLLIEAASLKYEEATDFSMKLYEQYVMGEGSKEAIVDARPVKEQAEVELNRAIADKEACEKQYRVFCKLLKASRKEVPLSEIVDCIEPRKSIFQNLTNLRRLKQAIQHYFRHRSF